MGVGTGPARLFGVLLLVAVPPLLALAALLALAPGAVERAGIWPLAIGIGLLAMAWSGIVAVGLAERLGLSPRSVLRLATGGRLHEQDATGDPLAPVAAALAERNRQIALLAHRARAGLRAADPRAGVHHVVETVRQVTGDPVWVLAVLSSRLESVPAGVYGTDPDTTPETIGDVHRWAATASDEAAPTGGARGLEGPWGAFVAVDVLATDDVRATLVAPRAGRPALLSAERDLLTLVGEYAAATIEHSVLLHQVQEQSTELLRLSGMQRDFLRGVTHDLQAPLTSIRALATEAIAGVGDSEAAEDLAAISHQADRLGRMVGQLLAMSRLEGGALEPRQEVFRPETIVRRAWRALHADRPFDLSVTGVPHLAWADPDRFEQVIWAVLDNAVRYSGPDAAIRVEIAGELTPDGPVSRTVIHDQGIGMSAEEQAKAFDRFYRADAARAVAPNGSGIGLHTADGLVRAMGGSISIQSGRGTGCAISITLPAEETPEGDGG